MNTDIQTLFLSSIPTIVTLIGWYIVNRQNNKRETRKEIRSAADKSKDLLREVSINGFEYWQGNPDVPAWKITSLLGELEVELCRFPDGKNLQTTLLNILTDLTDAITGGQFESKNRPVRTPKDKEMREIAKCRENLLRAIESKYKEHYS
ncbi:MAG: hypothetical protein ORN54_07245 [Cyclobacteriaceae bacterium]|nr:hypothetical protein [Cyclobacteriaceae bacterium]